MSTIDQRGDQPTNPRDYIMDSLRRVQMLWDDTRPSQDIGPLLGLDIVMIGSTPSSMRTASRSQEKAAVMSAFIDALGVSRQTASFRNYLIQTVSAQYDMGLSTNQVYPSFGIDLARDRIGPFEPDRMQETEAVYLEAELHSAPLRMVSGFFIMIPEEEENKMSIADCANLLVGLFINPSSGQLVDPAVVQSRAHSLPGGYDIFKYRLGEVKRAVDWADEYRETYKDDRFVEVADSLRRLSIYLDTESPNS